MARDTLRRHWTSIPLSHLFTLRTYPSLYPSPGRTSVISRFFPCPRCSSPVITIMSPSVHRQMQPIRSSHLASATTTTTTRRRHPRPQTPIQRLIWSSPPPPITSLSWWRSAPSLSRTMTTTVSSAASVGEGDGRPRAHPSPSPVASDFHVPAERRRADIVLIDGTNLLIGMKSMVVRGLKLSTCVVVGGVVCPCRRSPRVVEASTVPQPPHPHPLPDLHLPHLFSVSFRIASVPRPWGTYPRGCTRLELLSTRLHGGAATRVRLRPSRGWGVPATRGIPGL